MTKTPENMAQLEKEVINLIAERLGVPVDTVVYEAHLFKDLNASMLEKADLIQTLEEKYQIKFESDDIKSIDTIGNIIEYIIDNVD